MSGRSLSTRTEVPFWTSGESRICGHIGPDLEGMLEREYRQHTVLELLTSQRWPVGAVLASRAGGGDRVCAGVAWRHAWRPWRGHHGPMAYRATPGATKPRSLPRRQSEGRQSRSPIPRALCGAVVSPQP
jgi:hypothetical protein